MKAKEHIIGKAAQYIVENLNKVSEMDMEYGNQAVKIVMYMRGCINKIKRMVKGYTNGQMAQYTKECLNKT